MPPLTSCNCCKGITGLLSLSLSLSQRQVFIRVKTEKYAKSNKTQFSSWHCVWPRDHAWLFSCCMTMVLCLFEDIALTMMMRSCISSSLLLKIWKKSSKRKYSNDNLERKWFVEYIAQNYYQEIEYIHIIQMIRNPMQ